MVRPIEISDALTKAETVQRMQQNLKVQPEAAQHFQKTMTEKLSEQVSTPNPVPKDDEVVLHVEEKEEETRKRKQQEHEASQNYMEDESKSGKDDEDHPPLDHIDVKI